MLQAPAKRSPEFWGKILGFPSFFCKCGKARKKPGKARSVRALLVFQEFLENPGKPWQNFPRFPGFSLCAKKPRSFWLEWFLALPGSSLIPGFPGKPRDGLRASSAIWASEASLARTRERAAKRRGGRGKASRSCVLARLSSLAQIGKLARRLAKRN